MKVKITLTAQARRFLAAIIAGSTCADHTPCPEDYLQWHSWATRMHRTHRQRVCEECGRWAIWEPRRQEAA